MKKFLASDESNFVFIDNILGDYKEKLLDATFLITGGTGFFGTWFLNYFQYLNNNYKYNIRATVLSRNPEIFLKKHKNLICENFNFITSNIKDVDHLDKFKNYDYFLHMATTSAYETFTGSDLDKFEVLYDGTSNILNLIKNNSFKKFLFTSSGAVYGQHNNLINEDNGLNINTISLKNTLAIAKICTEHLISNFFKDNSKFVIARCFSFIGPGLPLDLHYAVGNFINNVLNDEDIVITGSGNEYRSYLDIRETIAWLIILLVSKNQKNIYNIGSDQKISIYELASRIKEIFNSNKNIIVLKKNQSYGNLYKNIYVPNIDLFKKEFQVEQTISLDESLNFIKKNSNE
tara:strand:- start:4523 stop:5563 length:1041 start_codon:yes stop_codon:yes gene_type:complete